MLPAPSPYLSNHSKRLLKNIYQMILSYGNGAGNTVEENSSVFSLIRMH